MRVLRVIARLNTGGPARQVTSIVRHLDTAQFDHRIVTGSVGAGEADDLALRGVSFEHRSIPGLGRDPSPVADLRALRALVAEIRSFRPHVVHTHTAKAGALGRIAALLSRTNPKLVHTFHGHLLYGYYPPWKVRLVAAVERLLARRTHRLLSVGATVRDELVAAGIGSLEQYVVMPPGIDVEPAPDRSEARAELGLPLGAEVVGFVARLTQVKRPDRFAKVALAVDARRPGTHFLIAGDGEMRSELARHLAPLGDRVHFTGWCAHIEAVYAASDVVLLTSDNEGMPVSLIEAALLGRPVVAPAVGSISEVVIDGVTGRVVEPTIDALAAAVIEVLDDPDQNHVGMRARTRAEELFSGARLVRDLSALYEELTC